MKKESSAGLLWIVFVWCCGGDMATSRSDVIFGCFKHVSWVFRAVGIVLYPILS